MKTEKETKEILEGVKHKDFISKLPWNKSGRIWGKRRIKDINKIIIHQSLSDGKLENINNYLISPGNHISPTIGCPHICYHLAIDKKGDILLLNNLTDQTWHTKGENRTSLSICVLGNFNGTGWNKGHEPTKEQLKTLEDLIEYLLDKLELKNDDIYGHYHFGKPACPGSACSEIVELFRQDKTADKANNKPAFKLDTVKDIQKALIKLGYSLPKYGADGIQGPETRHAITWFQIKSFLPLSGLADELTRAAIIKQISFKKL